MARASWQVGRSVSTGASEARQPAASPSYTSRGRAGLQSGAPLRPSVAWPRRDEGTQSGRSPGRIAAQKVLEPSPPQGAALRKRIRCGRQARGAPPGERKERGLRKHRRVGTCRVGGWRGVRTIQISGECTSQGRPQQSRESKAGNLVILRRGPMLLGRPLGD